MIGRFLTPMADKGDRGHRNINTNQPARVRGKIHKRFSSPPVSTGVQLICNGNSKDRCSRQRCENCDSLSGTPLCSVRLLHISVLQSFRSSVVVFKASSCILRHHSYSFFFRRLDNSPTHDSNVSALKKSASSSRDLQDMRFAEWLPFPLSSYLPLKSSSPALALYTLFCFSEAEINIARLLLPAPIMGVWL